MNVMLVSVRYPWTVIPIGLMGNYMNSLEHACVQPKDLWQNLLLA